MDEILRGYPIVIEIPVAWGEMDAFQHVNNIVYFRYFESARIAYLERIEAIRTMQNTGIGPILAEIRCRFKIPVTYPDTVSACARVSHLTDDHFIMEHIVVSHRHRKVAAQGSGRVVAFDYRRQCKATLPAAIQLKIRELEDRADFEPDRV
jgi:acyl-CoA thioester hydrolase